MIAVSLHVFDGARAIPMHGIDIGFILSVRLQQVVMAIDQHGRAGQEARIHAGRFLSIDFDQYKTLPLLSAGAESRTQPSQK